MRSPIKKIILYPISGAFLSVIFATFSQAQDVEKQENFVTQNDRANSIPEERRISSNLLDSINDRHLDGVKGQSLRVKTPPPPTTGKFDDPQLDILYYFSCFSAAFGEYELIKEASYAGDGGVGIFTKRRFKLINDWSKSKNKSSSLIDVTMNGGEILWKGEKIRMQNLEAKYKISGRYLLAVGVINHGSKNEFTEQPLFLEVDNGAIYSGNGWKLFEQGISIKKAKELAAKATPAGGCPK